ncbi:MAG: hypothetical protein Q7K45_04730 [Nanoarchaeota archaeon]|nr:hypothetical protein [Nanoarchaeota archaeon]
MDELHYQHFLGKFAEHVYALSRWKHKAAVFHHGEEAGFIAGEFVDYLASLPFGKELSYFGHTVRAVPFTIATKSITAANSLDSLLLEVEHQRGNGHPHFLYVLSDPLNMLNYDSQKKEGVYKIDITACIDLWKNQRKNNK